ncbi:spore coat protein [Sulfurifustis variabilis]|uniref:Spore coat protein n=1 Tax=Sulfurifustis variabilis TaxID=1675686 RepID=A0A1B4VDS0_9GAMM|nr:DegT/DnrJ/EryC1/StrS family aminotransferase [Sulfurifustis variabilis]BAU48607.1 spore coat protein [Sulfurifustis variabilis]
MAVIRKDFLPFGRPNFSREEIEAVTRVLTSGWIGMGPETMSFEEELAAFLGARHVVTVNSCTSALFLSLLVGGVDKGDEVICPSLTWCSTANAALYLGATPVFCDVDPYTLCATSETVRAKLTPRTKAVVVVHFGGLAADVDGIRDALPDGVRLVEDAAHALGTRLADGRNVGASGNLTCFSFYANKNLSTGEGGAIALRDDETAGRLRSLRLHGLPADAWKRFSNPAGRFVSELTELGYKMNYTDLQAAIGRVQLRRQAELHETRLAIAKYYRDRLSALDIGMGFQRGVTEWTHAHHLFVVFLPTERMSRGRDELLAELRKRNIGASIHYHPLHRMSLYGAVKQPALPVTERVADCILTLPISSSMTLEDARYVVDNLTELLSD